MLIVRSLRDRRVFHNPVFKGFPDRAGGLVPHTPLSIQFFKGIPRQFFRAFYVGVPDGR
jgi:hypothetical protein